MGQLSVKRAGKSVGKSKRNVLFSISLLLIKIIQLQGDRRFGYEICQMFLFMIIERKKNFSSEFNMPGYGFNYFM